MSNTQNSRNTAPAERMLCEQCGKPIPWSEYAVNFGLCDKCLFPDSDK